HMTSNNHTRHYRLEDPDAVMINPNEHPNPPKPAPNKKSTRHRQGPSTKRPTSFSNKPDTKQRRIAIEHASQKLKQAQQRRAQLPPTQLQEQIWDELQLPGPISTMVFANQEQPQVYLDECDAMMDVLNALMGKSGVGGQSESLPKEFDVDAAHRNSANDRVAAWVYNNGNYGAGPVSGNKITFDQQHCVGNKTFKDDDGVEARPRKRQRSEDGLGTKKKHIVDYVLEGDV
ncbi:hypothetical protein HDU76_011575, partial [Blyttiomyces sp. JEL0837]